MLPLRSFDGCRNASTLKREGGTLVQASFPFCSISWKASGDFASPAKRHAMPIIAMSPEAIVMVFSAILRRTWRLENNKKDEGGDIKETAKEGNKEGAKEQK